MDKNDIKLTVDGFYYLCGQTIIDTFGKMIESGEVVAYLSNGVVKLQSVCIGN